MRAQLNSYAGYSVGCAAVWAVILAVTQRQAEPGKRMMMQRFCLAWWSGWTSATIARAVYPPPKKLGSRPGKTLQIGSLVLVTLGVGSVIRFLRAARSHE
ncbi:MAG: hypothetical protein ACRENY_06665 [Candidatus Dormibacteria bacterium]